jgi:anaphase-promoting complex subunit 1
MCLWPADECRPVTPSQIKVFLSDNLSKTSVQINLMISPSSSSPFLYTCHARHLAFPESRHTIVPLHYLHCLSASPVLSTRHSVFDTLILHPDHTLSIHTSGNRSIPVIIPHSDSDGRDELPRQLASSLSMVLDDSASMSHHTGHRKMMMLKDEVGTRCTAVFVDGEQARMTFDFRIRSGLSRKCFEALSYILPAEAFFALKKKLLLRLQAGTTETVWDSFSQSVRALLGFSATSPHLSPLDSLTSKAENTSDSTTRRLAARVRARRPTPSTGATDVSASSTDVEFSETAAPILLALHLVAQDCRLSMRSRGDLKKVVALILDIAGQIGRIDWWDYWMRLLPCTPTTLEPICGMPFIETIVRAEFFRPRLGYLNIG